jgi:hypothetical protein
LLFLAQSVAQNNLILIDAAHHPGAQVGAEHRDTLQGGELFQPIDEVLKPHASILADPSGRDNERERDIGSTAAR